MNETEFVDEVTLMKDGTIIVRIGDNTRCIVAGKFSSEGW